LTNKNGNPSPEVARTILRSVLGATMIAHGVRHGRTLAGTTRWFDSLGFARPALQARLSSAVEVGAGGAVVAGAFTPLATSAIVGTMSVAYRTVHRPNGYFVVAEGWEYVGFVAASAVALSALGSGRYSIDRVLGLDRVGSPMLRAALTTVLGVAGAAGQLRMFWRPPTAPASDESA
jgi:putative oxidoreductase